MHDWNMTVLFFLLGVAFVPTVIYVSTKVLACMRPPKHRPVAFVLGGLFFVSASLFAAYLVVFAASSGSVPCALKSCDLSFDIELQPLGYWAAVAAWYGFAIASCGVGIAAIRKSTHGP